MLTSIVTNYRNVVIALALAAAIGAGGALITVIVRHDDNQPPVWMQREHATSDEMRQKDMDAMKRLLAR